METDKDERDGKVVVFVVWTIRIGLVGVAAYFLVVEDVPSRLPGLSSFQVWVNEHIPLVTKPRQTP